MAEPFSLQTFLLFLLLGVGIAQTTPPSIIKPLYGGNTCSSAKGVEDKQVTGNATLDRYYGWGHFPRCVIADPPQDLPSNWTYRCLGIPVVKNDSSYFAYPDDSPCSCDNGCYSYPDTPSTMPKLYFDHVPKDWVMQQVTNGSLEARDMVIDVTVGTNNTADGPSLGHIVVNGPPQMLASMHPNSGWKILDCQKHPNPQKLLAYCSRPHPMVSGKPANDPDSPQCRDVFYKGAKHTVVRLPHGCGSSLVARVASLKPTSKPLPDSEHRILGESKPNTTTVYELEIDYKFDEVHSDQGNVSLTVDFSNIPKYIASETSTNSSLRLGGWFDWFEEVTHFAEGSENVFAPSETFTQTLVDVTEICGGFMASLYISATGEFAANAKFAYKLVGSIVPFHLTDHYIYLEVDPSITVSLSAEGIVSYFFTTGKFPIVPMIGIPGLDYEPIIAFTPYVAVYGEFDGVLEISGSLTAQVTHDFAPMHLSLGNQKDDIDNETNRSPSPNNGGNTRISADVELLADLLFRITPEVGVDVSVGGGMVVKAKVALQVSGVISAKVEAEANTSGPPEACLSLDAGIDLSWVVSGELFNLWEAYAQAFFSATFNLYKKCFGGSSTRNSATSISSMTRRDGLLGGITCPKISNASCSLHSPPSNSTINVNTTVGKGGRFTLCGKQRVWNIKKKLLNLILIQYDPLTAIFQGEDSHEGSSIDHVLETAIMIKFVEGYDTDMSGSLCGFLFNEQNPNRFMTMLVNTDHVIRIDPATNNAKGLLNWQTIDYRHDPTTDDVKKKIKVIAGVVKYMNHQEVVKIALKAIRRFAEILDIFEKSVAGQHEGKYDGLVEKWKTYVRERYGIFSTNIDTSLATGMEKIKEHFSSEEEECYFNRITHLTRLTHLDILDQQF